MFPQTGSDLDPIYGHWSGTGTSRLTNTYVHGGDRYSTFVAGRVGQGRLGLVTTYIPPAFLLRPSLCCWQKWVSIPYPTLPYPSKKISSVKAAQ